MQYALHRSLTPEGHEPLRTDANTSQRILTKMARTIPPGTSMVFTELIPLLLSPDNSLLVKLPPARCVCVVYVRAEAPGSLFGLTAVGNVTRISPSRAKVGIVLEKILKTWTPFLSFCDRKYSLFASHLVIALMHRLIRAGKPQIHSRLRDGANLPTTVVFAGSEVSAVNEDREKRKDRGGGVLK